MRQRRLLTLSITFLLGVSMSFSITSNASGTSRGDIKPASDATIVENFQKNMSKFVISNDGTEVTNYYVQMDEASDIIKVTPANKDTGEYQTEENGYKSFYYTTETPTYINKRVVNITKESTRSKVSKTTNVTLPISCLESAQYVIALMHQSGLSVTYPGYGSPLAQSLDSKVAMVTGKSSYTLEDPNLTSHYGDAPYNFASMDYDGIIVIKKDRTFHAVSVAVRFSNGAFIALERDAGETEIIDKHVGDTEWLMNYYENPEDFRAGLGDSTAKMFALKYIK